MPHDQRMGVDRAPAYRLFQIRSERIGSEHTDDEWLAGAREGRLRPDHEAREIGYEDRLDLILGGRVGVRWTTQQGERKCDRAPKRQSPGKCNTAGQTEPLSF